MRIAVHAFDDISMFHLSTPVLVFDEVGRSGGADPWRTTVWTDGGGAVRTSGGLRIDGVAGADATADADILVFPSWPADLPAVPDGLVRLIVAAHARGATIVGLCLGGFPVVASGILDGRQAVTHWGSTAELAALRPEVDVDADSLYIDHGDVLTSAGTASALDACLHIVRERLGAAVAASVARSIVIAPHREGGQAQHVDAVPETGDVSDDIAPVLAWVEENLAERLTVEVLARRALMSRRSFTRRFRRATGATPAQWVRRRRLDAARVRLETATDPIGRIAEASGFGSAVAFRQAFVQAFGTTPTSYRRRFADAPRA
ncbi:GlxA family transcriptional regulator [Microbacterium karelineae]|uniref:GlxA family transcriptional regulator n=1 Tax=Microbacterium karelineae TaxID=2654283 RepID=UPI0012E9CDFF|nr:helix-turn-helix domain-containing protein [Microbacterium karelineae]